MAHDLERTADGRASFVYNQALGNPWHTLGTPFPAGITLPEALKAARVRPARKVPLYTMGDSGVTLVESHVGIESDHPETGKPVLLTVASATYHIVQFADVAEMAFAIVGAAPTDPVLDTMGVMGKKGERFFGFIDFGIVDHILPSGAIDRRARGLGFMSSNDATEAVTFYKSDIRGVCNNTVTAGISRAKHIIRVRHTAKADERLAQVHKILDLQYGGDAEFDAIIEQMDRRPGGHDLLEKVIRKVWPQPNVDAPDRSKAIWERRAEKIHSLYEMPSNQGGFGDTGWSVYNTVSEYVDHFVGDDPVRRARNAIDPRSGAAARKRLAADLVLAR